MVNLPPPCTSDKDAHPASANDGGVDSRFRPCRKRFSRLALGALFSLFAPRVFHNSFTTKRFRTLSQNCRGVTQQFPFWELFAEHNTERPLFLSSPFRAHLSVLPQASNRHFITSFHRCFPERVDFLPLAGHNFPSAPSPRMAPITEEGE